MNIQSNDFFINDRVIYTEYGFRLKGIITGKVNNKYYTFFQDKGINERLVSVQFLTLDKDPPPYKD